MRTRNLIRTILVNIGRSAANTAIHSGTYTAFILGGAVGGAVK